MSAKTKTDIHKKAMLKALEQTLGIVTQACKIAKVSRSQHYKWMSDDEDYKAEVESVGDVALDFAESKLHLAIESGNVAAVIFYLKTKGKKRGFIERIQTEDMNPPQPLSVEIIRANHGEEEDSSDD